MSSRREFIQWSAASLAALNIVGCSTSQQPLRLYGGFRNYGNTYGTACINNNGELLWKMHTADRVHEVCLQEDLRLGAVVARRPGKFIQLFDPVNGQDLGQIDTPEGLIFEGHALFRTSAEGIDELWATASATDTSESILLRYNLPNISAEQNAEPEHIPIPGLGPHQMLIQGSKIAVAVGGWKSVGRTILNADSFESGLVFFDPKTKESEFVSVTNSRLSARHLHADGDTLWVGMQLADPAPTTDVLLYSYSPIEGWREAQAPTTGWRSFNGYIASVAVGSEEIIATSPQGHIFGRWNHQGQALESVNSLDVSAAASIDGNLWLSTGVGEVFNSGKKVSSSIFWDNHWVGHAV